MEKYPIHGNSEERASSTTFSTVAAFDFPLWDTRVKLVNPSTDIVLAPYKKFSDFLFYARICAEHEAGIVNCSFLIITKT